MQDCIFFLLLFDAMRSNSSQCNGQVGGDWFNAL
jgi:hypothetical protein